MGPRLKIEIEQKVRSGGEELEIRKRIEYLEHQLNDKQAKDIVLGSLGRSDGS